MGHFLELGAKFDFCDRFVITLQQLCLTSKVTQFIFGGFRSQWGQKQWQLVRYSDISVSSVHTCDLTDFDEDSSDSDSDRCA